MLRQTGLDTAMPFELRICHHPNMYPPAFFVRFAGGRVTDPRPISSPHEFPVKGRPNSDLMTELRWYLEHFLEYPFPPETDRALHILEAIEAWGQHAFSALLCDQTLGSHFAGAFDSRPRIVIVGGDPRILAWPWEAMRDQNGDAIARTCSFERRLDRAAESILPSKPPLNDRIQILIVTARPYEKDVLYRSISRPLIEVVDRQHLPVQVEILRPPTISQLRRKLQEKPNFYHILHFDGHGTFGPRSHSPRTAKPMGSEGVLVFETETGMPSFLGAGDFGHLLERYPVSAVVLNACQSAAQKGSESEEAFASVSGTLLRSGVQCIIAMAYSLHASGARLFMSAFYQALFESGSMADAVRAGRVQMLENSKRVCARGEFPLADWLVPILYQHESLGFDIAQRRTGDNSESAHSHFPKEISKEIEPYAFTGRDGALLELERALRSKKPAVLVRGLSGVGKSTIVKELLRWLDCTGGLEDDCFWFHLPNFYKVEHILNRIGERVIDPLFPASVPGLDEKAEVLAKALRHRHFRIVWDNFEVVSRVAGSSIPSSFYSSGDLRLVVRFLDLLQGSKTKVLITSRSKEEWLGKDRVTEVLLGGLEGDERWEYCSAVLKELGLPVEHANPDLAILVDMLDGHPLSMAVILPRLAEMSPTEVVGALKCSPKKGQIETKLYAALGLAIDTLPEGVSPLLIPLAEHFRFVDSDCVKMMSQVAKIKWNQSEIDGFFLTLCNSGLLSDRNLGVYEMHPAIGGYLRSRLSTPSTALHAWRCGFVDVMSGLADHLTRQELQVQEEAFYVHGANIHNALDLAEQLGLDIEVAKIMQALASYAYNSRNFQTAAELFRRLAVHHSKSNNLEGEASAYHCLGAVADELRNWEQARQYFGRALALSEQTTDKAGVASAYHQLGMIAEEQAEWAEAQSLYLKSLKEFKRLGDEQSAASTCHHLGKIAYEQRQWNKAERLHRESLALFRQCGNDLGIADSFHQLGLIAQQQNKGKEAEGYYRKSLAITKKLGYDWHVAGDYHQLGTVALEAGKLNRAEQLFRRSLVIFDKIDDPYHVSITCHQLGVLAQERRDWGVAELWYRRSQAILEKLSDAGTPLSITYHNLGMVTRKQGKWKDSEEYLSQALRLFEKAKDTYRTASAHYELGLLAHRRQDLMEAKRHCLKSRRLFEEINEKQLAAMSSHQVGSIAQDEEDWDGAEHWFRKALDTFEAIGDQKGISQSSHNLGMVMQEKMDWNSAKYWYIKSLASAKKMFDTRGVALTYAQLGILYGLQKKYAHAGRWIVQAISIFAAVKDDQRVQSNTNNFLVFHHYATSDDQVLLRSIWQQANLGPLPQDPPNLPPSVQ